MHNVGERACTSWDGHCGVRVRCMLTRGGEGAHREIVEGKALDRLRSVAKDHAR